METINNVHEDETTDILPKSISRKGFLSLAGKTLAVGMAGNLLLSYQQLGNAQTVTKGVYTTPTGQKIGSIKPVSPPATIPAKVDEPIQLESWKSEVDQKPAPTPSPLPPEERIGYAVVGLGHLALGQIIPALVSCKKSKLTALVSGSKEKREKVAKQYGVPLSSCYGYEDYEKLKDNKEVQVIYIVLPNGMHAEYTIRGAQIGKHILCEKPMANTAAECEAMISACKKANVKLMIAYRIQYESYNRRARELVQSGKLGTPKMMNADNSQASANPAHWRHIKALAGGGALPDVGLYCLNTTRFVLGEEPTEVFAYEYSTPGNPLFKEVEELMSWQMKFPSGVVANCTTNYNVHESRRYRVLCTNGWVEVDPAFGYEGLQMKTAMAEGSTEKKEQLGLGAKDQFATEIDHFSDCVLHNKQPYTPGEEGLQDQKIMEAIYQSAKEGRPVKLPTITTKNTFRGAEPE